MATVQELDNIIGSIPTDIRQLPDNDLRSFKRFHEFREYFRGEQSYWQRIGPNDITAPLNEIVSVLASCEAQQIGAATNNIRNAVNKASQGGMIASSTARAKFIKSLHEEIGQEGVRGAYAYLYGLDFFQSLRSASGFAGVVAAIGKVRPEFISAALASEMDANIEQHQRLNDLSKSIDVRLQEQNLSFETQHSSIEVRAEEILTAAAVKFENTHADHSISHEAQLRALDESRAACEARIQTLETTVRETLRLQGPAMYWQELDRHYVTQGWIWLTATALFVCILTGGASALLYKTPAILTAETFTLSGLKGTLLVGAAVSGLLYLINLCVRVTTSCLHLSRDARERYQLTYVFLALVKDAALDDPKAREIVLTSLFSRADTGLLKGDSGPTMPGVAGFVSDIAKPKS